MNRSVVRSCLLRFRRVSGELVEVEELMGVVCVFVIGELRKELSLREIARRIGKSVTYLSFVGRGECKVSGDVFCLLCDLYLDRRKS